uniref:ITP n=1 Tax=Gryllus bimaculatus TaxID=6999 RepID=A0AB38ZPE1_GRYBI
MRRHSSLRSASLGAALALLALAALGALALAGRAAAGPTLAHPLSKRSFFDLQCKGVYDKSIFARLDRICEDCYNLFREPQLHSLCRSKCFTSPYFKGCIEALLLNEDEENLTQMVDFIGK